MGLIIAGGVKWVSQKVYSVFSRVGNLFKKLISLVADWFDKILGKSTASSANFVYNNKGYIEKAENKTIVTRDLALNQQINYLINIQQNIEKCLSARDKNIIERIKSRGHDNSIDINKETYDVPYVGYDEMQYYLNMNY